MRYTQNLYIYKYAWLWCDIYRRKEIKCIIISLPLARFYFNLNKSQNTTL